MREAQADAHTIPSNGGKNLKQNKANRGRARRGRARGTVCLDGSGYLAGKDNNFINKYLCAEQKLPFPPSSLLPLPLRSFSVSLLNSTIWR